LTDLSRCNPITCAKEIFSTAGESVKAG